MKTPWIVAKDGTGRFCSVQAAVNAVPVHQEERTVIYIKNGIYEEKVHVPHGKLISFIGESQFGTLLTYSRYAREVGPDGEEYGTFRTPSVRVEADDFYAENLTIANAAGYGPQIGQALALTMAGDRAVLYRVRLIGNQDTLFTPGNGRQYYRECYIEGHVDYIFGPAMAVFDRCQIHSLRSGYITAASTSQEQPYGYVFFDCRLTGETEDIVYLGRPWRPYGSVTFVRTWMDACIKSAGWDNWRKEENERTARYAEYGSIGPGAAAEGRVTWAETFSADACELTPASLLQGTDNWQHDTLVGEHAGGSPKVMIYLVGDSTLCEYGPSVRPRAGWGERLGLHFESHVKVSNEASSGRSSKSFIREGRLASILNRIEAGDYLFIQFGHNDQKPDEERSTEPSTTYKDYLTRYIEGARIKGAYPVLITPVQRRSLDEAGHFYDSHGDYPQAMRQLGAELNVPVIDLTEKSKLLYERLGAEATKSLLLWLEPGQHSNYPDGVQDNTHFAMKGAAVIAELVVQGIKEAKLPLATYIIR